MAFPSRSHLLGLLLLLSLPPEGAAALAALSSREAAQPAVPASESGPGEGAVGSLEQRMRRIEAALRARPPSQDARPGDGKADLAFTFVNGPGLGWGNGGFRNGGFYNGGFRNGGFRNGGWRNGGGAWRNGGGGAWRNGGFRNHW
jgi:rSAM-associated Gly-rich repeat protein